MKKSLLAVVLMVMAAIHAYAFTVDGLNYSASGTVATLTGATSKSITKLTIPATVTYGGKTYTVDHISGTAFHNYTSLRELIIEDSDTYIASDQYTNSHGWGVLGHPFEGCPLEKVYVGRNLADRISEGTYRGDITPISSTAESMDLTIAGKSTFIMSGGLNQSFEGKNIRSLTIGGNVVNIYKAAFKNCTSLKKVTFLPGSEPLDMTQSEIFDNCPLDTLKIHRNLQTNSYSTDRRINTVIFASDLNLFGFQMQSFATKLTNLIFEDTDEPVEVKGSVLYDTSIDSVYFGRYISGVTSDIRYNTSFRHVEFGPKITTIEEYFATTMSTLESVKFSDNVTHIKNKAFLQTALKEIELPGTLVEIGQSAFRECKNLKKITLPKRLENIGEGAFYLTAIEAVSLPASLKTIGGTVFGGCSELKNVIIEDSDEPLEFNGNVLYDTNLDSIYIGRYISGQTGGIRYNTSFRHVEFGPKITTIEEYFATTMSTLESVKFSGNVTHIKNKAFFQTALKEIELPGTLVEIGQSAFSECPLANIKCAGTTPPVCADKDVFSAEAYENTVVTVPPGSKKTYRNTEVWKLFKNLQSEGGGFKVTVIYDDTFGRVTLNESTATSITVDEDEPLTVAITPAEGYKVAALTVNGADMLASLADNRLVYESIDANLDINVEFSLMTFAVTLPQSLVGGRIVINGADEAPAAVDYGSRLEITPVADRGHELTSLSVNGTDIASSLDENGSYVIDRVTGEIAIGAAFSPIVYTVRAVNDTPYGTVTLNGEAGDCRIEFGKPLAVGVTPRDEGCYLVSLAVDGVDVTAQAAGGIYTIESVEADMTVEAAFAIHTYTISLGFDPTMGSIVPDMPADAQSVTVEHGTTLSLAIIPAEGYETAAVTLDGRDVTDRLATDGTLTIENITADHSVEATFEVKRVILTVLGLEGGRLAMRYDYATEVTLLIEPEEGWTFHSLTVGDDTVTELDSDNSYTTRPLTDHTDVSVVFRKASESVIGAVDSDGDNITVYARSRTVTIEGARDGEQVEIYDASGMAVYRGTEHVINLDRQGVHIVCVAGRTFKVMLR